MSFVFGLIKRAPRNIDLAYNPPGVTLIFSSDGMPLARYFVENREYVPITDIPLNLQHATVALEDRRFYTRKVAIDTEGIFRAIVDNIRHRNLHGQGASTITQQLARNLGVEGLSNEKSLQRKLKEWVVANQIEHSFTKENILEMYLNQINYGSGAYGVEAAARTYFGKHVKDLDLAECALLAGLPNRPTFLNPYHDKNAAMKQRNIVLDEMLAEKYITPRQHDEATAEPIKLASPHEPKLGSQIYRAPYFVSYVYDQLKARYGESYLKSGNLKVYTTLNWGMQQVAEAAVKHGLANATRTGPTEACLVAMDPKTGEIKAMVGGSNYQTDPFNIVTQARRQPGSLFKAILYSAAIESGLVTEDNTVLDARTSFPMGNGKWWTPKDDDGYSGRLVTLRDAVAQSINVPAVKVMKEVGPATVVQYARLMGITSPLDPVLSLALGTSAVTPLEMVDAYATFPNGGNHVAPVGYTTVEGPDGTVVDTYAAPRPEKVLSPETVQQLDDMLRAVVTGGTGTGAMAVPDACGKTGTTQEHKDVWFIGYTPRLVCGVWAGHPIHNERTGANSYGQSMAGNAWGATVCVPMWREFMLGGEPIFEKDEAIEAAKWKGKSTASPANPQEGSNSSSSTGGSSTAADRAAKTPGTKTRQALRPTAAVRNPDGSVTVNIDDATGMLAPPGSPNSSPVNFADGTEPTSMAPQYASQDGGQPASVGGTPVRVRPAAAQPANVNTTTAGPATGQPNTTPVPADNAGPSQNTPDDTGGTIVTTSPIATPPTPRVTNAQPSSGQPVYMAPPIILHSAQAAVPMAPPIRERPAPEYVWRDINPDDGLLATKWCPETVQKRFLKGTEPHRYSTEYQPPPGEH